MRSLDSIFKMLHAAAALKCSAAACKLNLHTSEQHNATLHYLSTAVQSQPTNSMQKLCAVCFHELKICYTNVQAKREAVFKDNKVLSTHYTKIAQASVCTLHAELSNKMLQFCSQN